MQFALTFDDVSLIPAFSQVLPREVDVKTHLTSQIILNIPLVSAAMDTVTDASLAIALAQEGGMGILHKNMSIADQAWQVKKVKKYESGIVLSPITVSPDTTVKTLLEITQQHNISGVPVTDGDDLVGIVTSRDVRFETNLDRPVSQIMTSKPKLVTVTESATREEVMHLLHQHRIEKILIVDKQFKLKGLITVKDILKARSKPQATKDEEGHLRVGAAVGTGEDTEERVHALVEAGVDLVVVDTAHGHSKRVLDKLKWIKKQFPELQLIGGNIATADGALALAQAGVDGVKVGIGPGSICTTRVVTGVGVPQITAIMNVASVLASKKISIIADGGIRFSGDICKALVAGAHAVMIGGLFAGTEEAPGETVLYQGRSYKTYRGMGSLGAMGQTQGSKDRYFQDQEGSLEKLVPEGIEGRVPYKGKLSAVVHQLVGGLRSGMGYTGCKTLDELRKNAKFVQVTQAGVRESHVHDVSITKASPNYQGEHHDEM